MKKIVFVCVENSCRSQIAEAFGNILGKGRVEVFSAGSRPSGQVNPKAIATMAELEYDLNQHQSKGLNDLPGGTYAAAVTMGCGDECPLIDAERRIDWGIPDPKHLSPEEFRKVRDLIRDKVTQLFQDLQLET